MRTVAEHQAAVRALLEPLRSRAPESMPTAGAASDHDRVLAHDVVSPIDHPPFDNSQMDGYAVRASDVTPGAGMPIGRRIAAGHPVGSLDPGTAAPIMTGAPIPLGADAVIPIEAATPDRFLPEIPSSPDGPARSTQTVSFAQPVASSSYVRRRGSDLAAGERLLAAGSRLGPARWGVLAASGITEVDVVSRVRVLVVSTGDELQRPGGELGPGRIFDGNGAAMSVAVVDAGGVVVATIRASDDADDLRSSIEPHLGSIDLILSTGGVSKGAYEVVRDVFEPAGVIFTSVAMQPGGPQGLGVAILPGSDAGSDVRSSGMPVIAFPGNPVSALVSFELFLRPALRELHGLPMQREQWLAPLAEALDSPVAKHQVRRGRVGASGAIEVVGGASSHLLHSYATSTVLVHVPVGTAHLDAGDSVEVWSLVD